jgi:hypothetical protein
MTSVGEIRQCDARVPAAWQRCVRDLGHDGTHFWSSDRLGHSDETEQSRLMAENAALRAQRDRLLRVLDDIYPALVSGIAALKAVRETVALADWDRMARLVHDAARVRHDDEGRTAPQDEHTCGDTQLIAPDSGDREAMLRQAIALVRRFALHVCADADGRSCGFCDARVDDHRAVLRHRPDCIYPEAWTFLMRQESQNALWAQALKIAMAKEAKGTKA